MKKDFLFSYLAELLVLISGVLIFKVVIHYFGSDGFSLFSLTKRSVSFILPAVTMGLGVGIPRYMAISKCSVSAKEVDSYVVSGLLLHALVFVVFALGLLLFNDEASYLLFGSAEYSGYIFSIVVMLLGLIVYSCVYSYFRGKLAITNAAIYKAINLGVFPIVSCVFASSVSMQMVIQGFSMVGVSAVFGLFFVRNLVPVREQIIPCSRDLIEYGLQRVPGDFCIAGILALPAIITAHFDGIERAGFIAFGITILNLLSAAFAPIGLILLPRVSELFARNEISTIKYYVNRIIVLSLAAGVLFFIVFELFAEFFLSFMFDDIDASMILIIRIMVVSSITLPLYVSLRSVLDAFHVKAINAINIYKVSTVMALAFFPGLFVALNSYYIAIVFAFTYSMLGVLTLREIGLVYKNTGVV